MKARHAWLLCGIAAILLALWSPVRHFEFLNFDDDQYITDNSHVIGGLTRANITWAFAGERGGHWHPLTWISHMTDCTVFGLRAGAHHLHNLALHIIIALLLYMLVWRVQRNRWLAMLVALGVGVHPLRLESVAWVAERKDVLGLVWGLAAIHAYLWWTQQPNGKRCALFCGAWILSLLSKPTFVTLPLLLLCLDAWPLRRMETPGAWRACVREKWPLAIVMSVFAGVALWAQAHGGGLRGDEYAWIDRLANVWVSYLTYAAKIFVPTGEGIFYPFAPYAPGVGVGAALSVLAATGAAWCVRRAQPTLWFAWSWYLIALLPMSGVVPIGGQAFADRWSYLPQIGLLWGTFAWLQTRPGWHWARIGSVVWIGLLAILTARELPHWRNSEAIFRRTLQVSPDNFMAHLNLGVALDARGALAEATEHYETALRLNPTYPEALNNLGGARARGGAFAEAEPLFRRALARRSTLDTANYNLGLLCAQTGRPWQATLWLWRAAQLHFAPAWDSLRLMAHRLPAACRTSLDADETQARSELQQVLTAAPMRDEPVETLRSAVECH